MVIQGGQKRRHMPKSEIKYFSITVVAQMCVIVNETLHIASKTPKSNKLVLDFAHTKLYQRQGG